jgi:hypothetical protein
MVLRGAQGHERGFGGMLGEWAELNTLGRTVAAIKKEQAAIEI